MSLAWYINRLRSMEPAEVLHRVGEKRRKLVSRASHQGWGRYPSPQLHRVFPGFVGRVEAATLPQRQAIAGAAGAVLAGRYCALGQTWPKRNPKDLFPPHLWRLDPVTRALWPDAETFAQDIDFRHDGSRGDIKYVWEVNRLQFLPVLAAHLLLEDDVRCAAAIGAAIGSWYAANPPFGGVGWASGIEVALRAISIIVTLDLAGDRLTARAREEASQILAASAFWLPRFPSRFSSANNHLVAELAGQYLIALALGTNGHASRGPLLAEVERQILPDGAGAEQSPTYAAFTAECALFCAQAAREAGEPFPTETEARLVAFADFIAWLGPSASFGDDDEGRVVTLGGEPDYAASVAAAIGGHLHRPGMLPCLDDFRSVVFGAQVGAAAPRAGLQTFPSGGLSVWHGQLAGRPVTLRFDHAPLGYLSIAAHGHADALSLTMDMDGRPILVDPGTFLYGSGGTWRSWFRSTPAHNTLNIDGQSQSTMSGAFNWSHKAVSRLLGRGEGPDWWLEAEHDGYHRTVGAIHRRLVRREGDAILVSDRLLGSPHAAEIVYQLAPGLEARTVGAVVTISCDGQRLLAIQFPDAAIAIASGSETPTPGGWVSERFGTKMPAPRVAWKGPIGEGGVLTRITPFAGVPLTKL
jgi:hypothetical protein